MNVAQNLALAAAAPEAVTAFISRLARWQAFLRRHGPAGLTLDARRGLFGELTFLRDELLPAVGGDAAVTSWKGCRGAAHDFQLPGGSVEVKTTSSVPVDLLHISNAAQLDNGGIPALFVCLIGVDEADGGQESLPDLVSSIRTSLDSGAAEAFDEALLEAGYLVAEEERYALPRYGVRLKVYYHIRDGFPRLTERMLPSGITDVQYVISVAACDSFSTEKPQVLDAITKRTE